MARTWHEIFQEWWRPPTESDETKAANAADRIRLALRESGCLDTNNFHVVATGSYKNNTNIRRDSDMDIAVILNEVHLDGTPGRSSQTKTQQSQVVGRLFDFRDQVGVALVDRFGRDRVQSGDKTYHVSESRSQLEADVTVFVQHRRSDLPFLARNGEDYLVGAETRPRSDSSTRIVNWPAQHYSRGVARNDETGRRFKRVVRILKRLRNEMVASGGDFEREAAQAAPSFFIESLVYNAPHDCFGDTADSYVDDVVNIFRWMEDIFAVYEQDNLFEVNDIKLLFDVGQPWTLDHAYDFAYASMEYMERTRRY